MSREATNKVLEMVDEGMLDARDVLLAALKYMSEDDVRGMCHMNEIEWSEDDEAEGEEGEQ
jgi:hypothetical protein